MVHTPRTEVLGTHSLPNSMFIFIKDVYLTCFTLFYRFACKRWSHPSNVGKGVGGVTLVEGILLMMIAAWIEIYYGKRFILNNGRLTMWIAFVVLAILNWHFLVARAYGIKFEREFSKFERARRLRLILNCVTVLLVLLAFTIYSIYTYQHFFHIVAQHH